MTVVNPKSISGINSITTGSGSDNLLTIHTNDGTERVRVDSTGTTKIVTGIVTTLTATTGIVTTLTTNTLTANSTAKVGSGVTLSPDGDVFATGVTTSTTVNVGAAVTISESGIEASGIGITCASINGNQIGGRRNLIINGAMEVAQRATSSTVSGFATLDRFLVLHSGTDESPTQAQVDVASGTTPYTLGFRKALKILNGNQTSGAGTADYILINYKCESQDIAKSGWNYTDPNSFITFSFWVKSSVAQNFYVRTISDDTTKQRYAFETGSLTADTWTKVIKTIPGNSNLVFNNDTGIGLYFRFYLYRGTDHTDNAVNLNQWETHNSSQNVPDVTSTWYTTNDATFEMTGVQLEVGSQATAFEHLRFAEELALCQRYFFKNINESGESGCNYGKAYSASEMFAAVRFPTAMRATPTVTSYGNAGTSGTVHKLGSPDITYTSIDRQDVYGGLRFNSSSAWATGDTDMYSFTFQADAEL